MFGESSITKTNNSAWTKSTMWDSAQSPTTSVKTQYHSSSSHSNSKESLWHSTQSSPNSHLKEQLQTASSSSQTNLWENPISKMSQASLMHSKGSSGSIWSTPLTQSPVSKLSNIWDTACTLSATSGYPNQKPAELQHQSYGSAGHRLIRPQDISNDVWSNNTSAMGVPKAKDPVGALWANPTPSSYSHKQTSHKNTMCKPSRYNSPPSTASVTNTAPSTDLTVQSMPTNTYNHIIQSNPNNPTLHNTNNNNNQNIHTPNTANHLANNYPSSSAASSCLQLFSDEFLNYLNMIN